MPDRTYGIRQSEFVEQTAIPSGSYIGIWNNGINYKMAYGNFMAGLGVTGTIVQAGAVTGTPVLDVAGTVNSIRNIESGSGIYAAVSASNGVSVQHNFTVDATGKPLMLNQTTASPTFVSLVASTGITLAAVGNTVTIANASAAAEARGQVYMQGNATATVIASTSVPVLVAGTWTVDLQSQMTGTTGGRLTYTGTTTQYMRVNAALSLDPISGANQDLQVYLAKNGTVIAGSRIETIVTHLAHQAVPLTWQLQMAANDYIEIFVQNLTATNNITVSRVVLSIH
jgi:hypothetical protein